MSFLVVAARVGIAIALAWLLMALVIVIVAGVVIARDHRRRTIHWPPPKRRPF